MYLNFDQGIVCQEFDDDKCNDEFFVELDQTPEGATCKDRRLQEDEATCSSDEEEPVQLTIKITSKALQLLEQAQYFLDFFGHGSVTNDIGIVIDKAAALQMKQWVNAKQCISMITSHEPCSICPDHTHFTVNHKKLLVT